MTDGESRLKEAIYEQFARIGKAMSSPRRIELLELLAQGERTVEVLAGETQMSVANTSRHLQVLRGVRLVDARKEGLYVTYRLSTPEVARFLRSLRKVAEARLIELDWLMGQYLEGKGDLEPVDRNGLIERLRAGTVTLIDVRPVEEYRAGHIPGSVSIPLRHLERRLDELPKGREIVAYCRGPYCVLAMQAVELLRKKGYRASHLREGIPEWQSLGLPVEGEETKS